jgi:SAM-dependent methyltransferase
MSGIFKKILKDYKVEIAKKKEFCPCCETETFILVLKPLKNNLKIETRNNYACANCLSLLRHRVLAENFLRYFKLASLKDFKIRLKGGKLKIYDANIPPLFPLINEPNYVISSFSSSKKFKFQDLEKLTFGSSCFDAVITCDILEHVFDLNAALSQIERVLKPKGVHFFTLPVNFKAQRTILRALREKGKIIDLKPSLYHLNLFENKKILAVRDFGKDFKKHIDKKFNVRIFRRKRYGFIIDFFQGIKK